MTAPVGTHAAVKLDGTDTAPGEARRFVREALTGSGASVDDAVVVVSELVTNSLRYSKSGEPGGKIIVAVAVDDVARIEVRDEGSKNGHFPVLRTDFDEKGRGLVVVKGYAARWGFDLAEHFTMVWFELPRTAP